MNFGLQWNRYTMRGPTHGKYFDFVIGCLCNLCKNVYIWCRLSSNGLFGPNKNGLHRFHRCFTGNSKCLPCANYLKVYLVQCCQKFTFEIVIYFCISFQKRYQSNLKKLEICFIYFVGLLHSGPENLKKSRQTKTREIK